MSSFDSGTVCICIAAHNAELTIARAVASALMQEHVTEVIVVDDASVDATVKVANGCDDGSGRLTVLLQDRNRGPAAARNAAIERSKAEYFCVLDADDYLLPGRVSRLLSFGGPWDLLADDILFVPEDISGASLNVPENWENLDFSSLDIQTFVRRNISLSRKPRGELGFLKPIIRRTFIDAIGLRYDSEMRLGEDYALYARALLENARFLITGFCGYVAVERSTSLSSNHGSNDLDIIRSFDSRCLATSRMTSSTRQAFEAHLRSVTRKWALAKTIEIRREEGFASALRFLSGQPLSLPWVILKIADAKWSKWSTKGKLRPLKLRYLSGDGPVVTISES